MLKIQLKRGSSQSVLNAVEPTGTLTVNSDKQQMRLHDGSTSGGHPVLYNQNILDLSETIANLNVESISGLDIALGLRASRDQINQLNGILGLDQDAKVSASQLPGFVDDIEEHAGVVDFPETGDRGKIYIDTLTSAMYRWNGTAYMTISANAQTTDEMVEGQNGLFFNESLVRIALGSAGDIDYDPTSGVFSFEESINSVNGQTEEVVLGKTEVALSEVQDYELPTKDDAEVAQSDSMFMSPLNTRQFMEGIGLAQTLGAWGFDSGKFTHGEIIYSTAQRLSDGTLKYREIATKNSVSTGSATERVVVGAPKGNSAVESSGSAFVLVKEAEGWIVTQDLAEITPDLYTYDYFGCSTAMTPDGSVVVVGVKNEDETFTKTNTGRADVFVWNGSEYEHHSTIMAPLHLNKAAYFGFNVSCNDDGSVLAISSPWTEVVDSEDIARLSAGTIHTYKLTSDVYEHVQEFPGIAPGAGSRFGEQLKFFNNGTKLLAATAAGYTSTRVEIFDVDSDGQATPALHIPYPSSTYKNGYWCASVDITPDGQTMVVGADRLNKAFIYKLEDGEYIEKYFVEAPLFVNYSTYANNVAISEDASVLIVSDTRNDDKGGAVYVYVDKDDGNGFEHKYTLNGETQHNTNNYGEGIHILPNKELFIRGKSISYGDGKEFLDCYGLES